MIYIDGLECEIYNREVLKELTASKMGAVTVTVAFWEDALETMDALVKWNNLERENSDLIVIARTLEDIVSSARGDRTAIILGSQNSTPIVDRLGFVELFWRMGLRVMQLTYNNQNAIGGSCYDPSDSGLSRFGREVIGEMNRVGMVVDLSHVGDKTTLDAIENSAQPVAITHANPRSLYDHPRNKPDHVIKLLAQKRGVLGLAAYNNIAGEYCATAENWCDLICRTVDLIGIESVGIGTDLAQNSGPERLEWMRKGRWTQTSQSGATLEGRPTPPESWFNSTFKFEDTQQVLQSSQRFTDNEIQAVLGGNWLRLYGEVFK